MPEAAEKRGPIEKGEKGWPVNPIGLAALIIFGLIIIFLIARPLFQRKATIIQQDQQQVSEGGNITAPQAGEIVRASTLPINLSVDDQGNVAKVQFWAKTYADGQWQVIGEVENSPYNLNWQIPESFQNKAIAITSHIITRDDQIIKDPGGWREGIIILSE